MNKLCHGFKNNDKVNLLFINIFYPSSFLAKTHVWAQGVITIRFIIISSLRPTNLDFLVLL